MKVDPGGLASAAQRITAALAQLPTGHEVHPPLAADPASQGGAARLTTGATTLAALIGEQAAGLATTAEVLGGIATGFDGIEGANFANLSNLGGSAVSAPFSGFAPPAVQSPDVRPPLPAPPAVMGEAISRATHAGDPGAGESFISGWRRVADAVDDAAHVVAQVVDNLPETWNSEVATPVVRTHLLNYHSALTGSGTRARGLASQADQHAGDVIQARHDIPPPREFDDLNQQIRQTWEANRASGGKYGPALATLYGRKADLNARAVQGLGTLYAKTDTTTAAHLEDENALAMSDPGAGAEGADPTSPGDPAGGDQTDAAQGLDPAAANPGSAGELAGLLPQLIPTVLGAAGGLVGGVMSTLTTAPEALAQAASQAAGAAVQGVSGAIGPDNDSPDVGESDPGLSGDPSGLPGGEGETTPAAGGPTSPTPPVVPSTGPTPTPPTIPAGGLPQPVEAAPGSGPATMPIGMPLGGMMPPGGGPGAGRQKGQRPHDVVVPRTPHTESVTGKVSEDRIAVSSTAPRSDNPPNDDSLPPAKGPQPLIRRITMAPSKDDDES